MILSVVWNFVELRNLYLCNIFYAEFGFYVGIKIFYFILIFYNETFFFFFFKFVFKFYLSFWVISNLVLYLV